MDNDRNGIMGPGDRVDSAYKFIPIEELERAWRHEARIFVYVRTEYNDVFGLPHHTENLMEMHIVGNPRFVFTDPNAPVSDIAWYKAYGGQNSAT